MSVYEIKTSINKGLGMFTTQKIGAGARILSEKPTFTAPTDVWTSNPRDMLTQFRALPKEERDAYLLLHAPQQKIDLLAQILRPALPLLPEEAQKLAIIIAAIHETNAFGMGTQSGMAGLASVFLQTSRINHSCCPNATCSWNENLARLTVHATKNIPAEEEISISYLANPWKSHCRRQESLREGYFFMCTCPACDITVVNTEEGKVSRIRRERICRLSLDLDFFRRRNVKREVVGPLTTGLVDEEAGEETPFAILDEVVQLAVAEGLTLEYLPEWYRYAAEWCTTRAAEDMNRILYWSQRAKTGFELIKGRDHEDTINMKERIESFMALRMARLSVPSWEQQR